MSIKRVLGYDMIMLKNNVSKIMGEKRMKIAELIRLAGISEGTAMKLYHDKSKNISLKTLERLCYALECTPSDIFEYIPE